MHWRARKSLKTSDLDGETAAAAGRRPLPARPGAGCVQPHARCRKSRTFAPPRWKRCGRWWPPAAASRCCRSWPAAAPMACAAAWRIVPFARPVPVRHIGALWRKTTARSSGHRGRVRRDRRAPAPQDLSAHEPPHEISVYDRMVWPEAPVGRCWPSASAGANCAPTSARPNTPRCSPWRRAAAQRPAIRDRCVFVRARHHGFAAGRAARDSPPDNLLWLDPADFQHGDLMQLALPGQGCRSHAGPVLYTYLPLKFALRGRVATRCAASTMTGGGTSAELGLALSRRIAIEPARHVSVIGHSMGGLLVAASRCAPRRVRAVQRLITLGTPHGGIYAPVQALRGVYPLVRRLAQLDPRAQRRNAGARCVRHLPQPVPDAAARSDGLDLLDPRNWPSHGPQPNAHAAGRVHAARPGRRGPRIGSIAGYGYDTVVNVARVHDELLLPRRRRGRRHRAHGARHAAGHARPGTAGWRTTSCRAARRCRRRLVALLAAETPPLLPAPPAARATSRVRYRDGELRTTVHHQDRLVEARPCRAPSLPGFAQRACGTAGTQDEHGPVLVPAGPAPRGQPRAARGHAQLRAVVPVYVWSPDEEGAWAPGAARALVAA